MRIIIYHPVFLEDWKNLDSKVKKKALRQIYLFQKNLHHGSLRNHKLSGTMKEFWAFSITLDYRIVYFYDQKGHIIFLRIGRHKDVY